MARTAGQGALKLQARVGEDWRDIGEVTLLGMEREGLNAATEFCYDLDYATAYAERQDRHAVSCHMAVGFEPIECQGWPPFLLDLFPQGAALQYVVDHYRIADRPENYWRIIKTARLNPPGNLRVVADQGPESARKIRHPGFSRAEVVSKGPSFLEYMVVHGAPVAGTTGAGGAAPKFLLREDHSGCFHADGVLPDSETKRCWLVKFPRGRESIDRDILRAEKVYADVARSLGLSVQNVESWENNCLFIERFDRKVLNPKIDYLGMESFYSLVGVPEFGSRLHHETYIQALSRYSTEPHRDVIEYVLRDILNVMLGNTDNHGRNSALLKGDGWLGLAPLYDFAPMMFDPEGIVRNTRWQEGREGNIEAIADFLEKNSHADRKDFGARLATFYREALSLDKSLATFGVPEMFIDGTREERERMLTKLGRYLERS